MKSVLWVVEGRISEWDEWEVMVVTRTRESARSAAQDLRSHGYEVSIGKYVRAA